MNDIGSETSANTSSLKHFGWAFSYGLISVLALVAGQIIAVSSGAPPDTFRILVPTPEWWLLLAPGGAGLFFSICYAISQHRTSNEPSVAPAPYERAFLWSVFSVALLLILFGFTQYGALPGYFLVAVLLHTTACVSYSFFLLQKRRDGTDQLVRHQLVWPVVMAVGINLYIGLSLHSLLNGPTALGPLILTLAWVAIGVRSNPTDTRLFGSSMILLSLSVFTIVAIRLLVPLYDRNGFWGHFAAMVFALTVAAYLAVLESWQITAEHATADLTQVRKDNKADTVSLSVTDISSGFRTAKYYLATLAALCISIAVLPLAYTFTNSGLVFIYFFPFFAIATLAVWISGIDTASELTRRHWSKWKICFAAAFLGLVVADATIPLEFGIVFQSSTASSLQNIVAVCVGFLTLRLADDPKWQNRRGGILSSVEVVGEVLSERRNALRMLGLISFVAMMGLSLWQQQQVHPVQTPYASGEELRYLRVNAAIGAYGILVFAMAIAELFHRNRRPGSVSIATVVALLSLGRTVSILLVGGVITFGTLALGSPLGSALAIAVPFVLCVAGGGALNDYFDRQKDAVDKPWRAIPTGVASPHVVLGVACGLLASAMASSVIVGYSVQDQLLLLLAVGGVIAYNMVVRHAGVFKGLMTGCLCAIPVVFVLRNSSTPVAPFAIAVVLFVAGREILMDTLDVLGDRVGRSRTLVLVFGERFASILGFMLQTVGLSLFSVGLAGQLSQLTSAVHLLAIAVTSLVGLGWFYGASERRTLVYWLWLPLAAECTVLVLTLH